MKRRRLTFVAALFAALTAPLAAQGRPGKTLVPAMAGARDVAVRPSLLFRDDFAKFPSVEGGGGRYRYTDGGLEVSAGDAAPLWVILWDRGRMPANLRATVTVQVTRSGRGGAGGGLTWAVQNRDAMDQGSRAEVSPAGVVLVTAPDAPAPPPSQLAPAVHRGEGSTNTLTVETLRGHVTVSVNGVVVRQLDSRALGYLGVFADVGSRVVFTNLRVDQLN